MNLYILYIPKYDVVKWPSKRLSASYLCLHVLLVFIPFCKAIYQTHVNPRSRKIDVPTDGMNAHTDEVITGFPPIYNLHN